VAEVALKAMAEGRTRHAPDQAAAGGEGEGGASEGEEEEGEEWTTEQLSDAALLASSVLASQGPSQVNGFLFRLLLGPCYWAAITGS
jgi:hypothetical protein